MNIVAVVGNVASEPVLKQTPSGKDICEFRIAVSRPGSSSAADFMTIVAWDRQAQICQQFLWVGRRVAVDGRLRHSVWEVEEGGEKRTRSKIDIVAHRIHLLGGTRPTAKDAKIDSSERDDRDGSSRADPFAASDVREAAVV